MTDGSAARGRERGFTLLEIMIALAILAVGAVCVLSTFAAAIAMHLRREDDVRTARVVDEARTAAQTAWDAHIPSRRRPFPADREEEPWSRDGTVTWSYVFSALDGQPLGLDGTPQGAVAEIRIVTEGREDRPRVQTIVLARRGFQEGSLRKSWTHEQEQKIDEMEKYDPSRSGDR